MVFKVDDLDIFQKVEEEVDIMEYLQMKQREFLRWC